MSARNERTLTGLRTTQTISYREAVDVAQQMWVLPSGAFTPPMRCSALKASKKPSLSKRSCADISALCQKCLYLNVLCGGPAARPSPGLGAYERRYGYQSNPAPDQRQ